MFFKAALGLMIFLLLVKENTILIGEYFTSKGLDSYRLHLMKDGRFSHTYSGCTLGFEATGEWNVQDDTLKLFTQEVRTIYPNGKRKADKSDQLWTIASSVKSFVVRRDSILQLEPLDNRLIFTTVRKIKP